MAAAAPATPAHSHVHLPPASGGTAPAFEAAVVKTTDKELTVTHIRNVEEACCTNRTLSKLITLVGFLITVIGTVALLGVLYPTATPFLTAVGQSTAEAAMGIGTSAVNLAAFTIAIGGGMLLIGASTWGYKCWNASKLREAQLAQIEQEATKKAATAAAPKGAAPAPAVDPAAAPAPGASQAAAAAAGAAPAPGASPAPAPADNVERRLVSAAELSSIGREGVYTALAQLGLISLDEHGHWQSNIETMVRYLKLPEMVAFERALSQTRHELSQAQAHIAHLSGQLLPEPAPAHAHAHAHAHDVDDPFALPRDDDSKAGLPANADGAPSAVAPTVTLQALPADALPLPPPTPAQSDAAPAEAGVGAGASEGDEKVRGKDRDEKEKPAAASAAPAAAQPAAAAVQPSPSPQLDGVPALLQTPAHAAAQPAAEAKAGGAVTPPPTHPATAGKETPKPLSLAELGRLTGYHKEATAKKDLGINKNDYALLKARADANKQDYS